LPIDQEAELRAIPSASVRCGDTAQGIRSDQDSVSPNREEI
jgi:hypothetical protein